MSNALSTLRDQLAATLNEKKLSAEAFATVPEEAGPPLVAISGGSPYVSFEGASFGTAIVRLRALLVVEQSENAAEDEALDALILEVLDALQRNEFHVEQVEEPSGVTVNGQLCLGVFVNVWTEAELGT